MTCGGAFIAEAKRVNDSEFQVPGTAAALPVGSRTARAPIVTAPASTPSGR